MSLIQLRHSTANSAPQTLNIGEPAYSYVSNTFFIGTANDDGYLVIGGQAYIDKINSAFDVANSANIGLLNINGGSF
jgi:hypothetical protein